MAGRTGVAGRSFGELPLRDGDEKDVWSFGNDGRLEVTGARAGKFVVVVDIVGGNIVDEVLVIVFA